MRYKDLSLLIFILPIASLLVTIVLLAVTYNFQQKRQLNDSTRFIEDTYVEHALSMEASRIESSFGVVIKDYIHMEVLLRPILRDEFSRTYRLLENVLQLAGLGIDADRAAIEALGELRFKEGVSAFVFDSRAVLRFPPEGDAPFWLKRTAPIQLYNRAKTLLSTHKEGFIRLSLDTGSHRRNILIYAGKLSFNRWIVGCGTCLCDQRHALLEHFAQMYARQKHESGEYFVAAKLVGSSAEVLAATDGYPRTLDCIKSEDFICRLLTLLKKGPGRGSIRYTRNGRMQVVYYRFFDEADLLVASGIDISAMEAAIQRAKSSYMRRFVAYRNRMLGFSAGVVIFVGIVFLGVSRGVNRLFYHYRSEIELQKSKLANLASHDELTGIYNRRRFNEILRHEINMSRRYGMPLSLIMFDLDHFKKVNDRYGHRAGDVVLQRIALFVQHHIRSTDTLARWGGEEFFLVLPNTTIRGAYRIAENLRRSIAAIPMGKVGSVTCSFGVTQLKSKDTPESFIERADKAMYEAKRKGRNRTCVFA